MSIVLVQEVKSTELHNGGHAPGQLQRQGSTHATEAVNVTWEQVRYEVDVSVNGVKGKKVLLDDVSGFCQAGQLTGIMGPSGSGKTTLLDILAGRIDQSKWSGSVRGNGDEGFRTKAVYVPQFDALMGVLTVRETLEYAAKLLMPDTPAARKARVERVIDMLGLAECADVKVGNAFYRGISGGHRKRLSVAVELISSPPCVFLDEPTTGLDSAAAEGVVEVLRRVADHGFSVIASLHQPSSSSFFKLDNVLFLSGGKVAYFGPPTGVVPFFSQLHRVCPADENPADFVMTIINRDFDAFSADDVTDLAKRGDPIADVFDHCRASLKPQVLQQARDAAQQGASRAAGAAGSAAASGPRIGCWSRTMTLLHRNFVNQWRNPIVIWVRVALFCMLGLMMGSLYWRNGHVDSVPAELCTHAMEHEGVTDCSTLLNAADIRDRISCISFVCMFFSFMAIAALPAFMEDRALFHREVANGHYTALPYTVANTISCLPASFLNALLSISILYWMVQLNDSEPDRFWGFYVVFAVQLFCTESMVAFFSAVIPIFILALLVGSSLMAMFCILSGFFLLPANIPWLWRWMYYSMSNFNYALAGMITNEFADANFVRDRLVTLAAGNTTVTTALIRGNDIIAQWGLNTNRYDMGRIGFSIVILIAMTFAWRVLLYVACRFLTRGKHRV